MVSRAGYPDEFARAVLFLTSDMASYISSAKVIVDGAQTALQRFSFLDTTCIC